MNKDKIIGEVYLTNGENYTYTDCHEYIGAIRTELKRQGLVPYERISFDTEEEWERFRMKFTESKNNHPTFHTIEDAMQYTFDNFIMFRTLTYDPDVREAVEKLLSDFYNIEVHRSTRWYKNKYQMLFIEEKILDFFYLYGYLNDEEYDDITFDDTMITDMLQNGANGSIGNSLKTIIKKALQNSECKDLEEEKLHINSSQSINMVQEAHELLTCLRLLTKEYIYVTKDDRISARIIFDTPDTVTLERYQNWGQERINDITMDRNEFGKEYTAVDMIPEAIVIGKYDFDWYISLYFETRKEFIDSE